MAREAEHGNMLLAWTHGVDPKGTNHVSEEEFKEACGKVGLPLTELVQVSMRLQLV